MVWSLVAENPEFGNALPCTGKCGGESKMERKHVVQEDTSSLRVPLFPRLNVMAGPFCSETQGMAGTLLTRSPACVVLQTHAAFNCTCLMNGEAYLEWLFSSKIREKWTERVELLVNSLCALKNGSCLMTQEEPPGNRDKLQQWGLCLLHFWRLQYVWLLGLTPSDKWGLCDGCVVVGQLGKDSSPSSDLCQSRASGGWYPLSVSLSFLTCKLKINTTIFIGLLQVGS